MLCSILIFFCGFITKRTYQQNCSNKYLSYLKYDDDNTTISIFSNFENLTEVQTQINCDQTFNITDYMTFIPFKPCLIDKSFSIKSFIINRLVGKLKSVAVINIYGIDIERNFISQSYKNDTIYPIDSIRFLYSKIDIYSRKVLLNSSNCNLKSYDGPNEFFNSFLKVIFTKVSYPTEWCPYFFRKSSIVQIYFGDITNSFLYKNRLNFIPLNNSKEAVLLNGLRMKELKTVSLFLNYEILTANILYDSLFGKIRELSINGVINGIEESVLKNFEYLQNLDLGIDNFKDFFQNGNLWMKSLNFYVKYNLSSHISSKVINANLFLLRCQYLKKHVSFDLIYEYPDEDLCLFKYFPHDRLVYPILNPGKHLECTCTLKWLQLYSFIYTFKINISNYDDNYQYHIFPTLLNGTFMFCNDSNDLMNCDLDKRIKTCTIQSIQQNEMEMNSDRSFSKLNNDVDFFFLIKWLQFILLTILQPSLCLIGIITNLFTVFVIKNKSKEKEFKHAMYQFALLNSLFNISYCLIMSFKLINTCIFYGSSIFCSSLYLKNASQQFKIIFIFYFGNVFKMCSNLSYLSFTISRLIVITFYTENAIPAFPAKNLLSFFILFLLTSCVLNLFKLFQFTINSSYLFHEEFPYEIRNEAFCEKIENQFQCKLFNGFKISHRIFNDVLFVIVNIIVDSVLLQRFRKQMDLKARQVVDLDHHKRIRESKTRINRMVLTNSIIYVVSHLPEFFSSLLLVIKAKNILNFCQRNVSCDLINEEAEFFGLISISVQFFIYTIFDKNFKNSFNDLSFISCCRRRNVVDNPRPRSNPNPRIRVETIALTNLNRPIGN